ncbi:ABC transporter substrate-binding protein [Salinicola aestuarinus]|uniref:ABC transporter substrate-binding protein n=1 Tax=Salinicola aestuarinus TaxID=1949082 RepID=UPI000DA1F4A0|nr:ABC transporter substrate-binding protein [Salinicola aestuarinus]
MPALQDRYRFLGLCLLLAAMVSGWAAPAAHADGFPLTVTDLAGREVTLDAPPRRLFLDDPRHLLALATLLPNPVARMSGWRGSLSRFDSEAQARFADAFPELDSLPSLGHGNAPLSAESLLTLSPDLVVTNLARYPDLHNSPLLDQLEALGIPVVFIDFQRHPLADTVPSLALLGDVLDAKPRAAALTQRLQAAIEAVDDCVDGVTASPSVLIDIAPGLKTDCCRSNFDTGLADLVERAGGDNIAAGLSPGSENVLNPEAILARNPDVIVATAAGWSQGGSIRAGFGVEVNTTHHDMAKVVARRPGWPTLSAVTDGRFHALWHGYHQGPFAAIALQTIARWLHPRQCAALDPQATQDALFTSELPITTDGTFQTTYPAASDTR